MNKWKNIILSKEEEEGVMTVVDEVSGKENFQRMLADKFWIDKNFNARAFTNTMVRAWKLKNPLKTQELSKIFSCLGPLPREIWNVCCEMVLRALTRTSPRSCIRGRTTLRSEHAFWSLLGMDL
ncbi:unnamed protein product [Lathyrus sativus]|nr:unnamed protein product [Lathyrus sativus]